MALIPPFFLDCVVAIGTVTPGNQAHWAASGFLYGRFEKQISDTRATYHTYLVTNRHVFDDQAAVWLRFNPEAAEPARQFLLPLSRSDGSRTWFAHPNAAVDVAVAPLDLHPLRDQNIRFSFFQSDKHVADRARAVELGLSEGDGVFTPGFPFGLVGGERTYVIVRHGSIARDSGTPSPARATSS